MGEPVTPVPPPTASEPWPGSARTSWPLFADCGSLVSSQFVALALNQGERLGERSNALVCQPVPTGLPLLDQRELRMVVPRFGRTVVGMDLIVVLLVVLIVLALVGSVAVSPLLWVLVVILVLFAVLGRGRYYARRG
jgi:Flp pilus assembly protein TadB